jgi:hypothetical protein
MDKTPKLAWFLILSFKQCCLVCFLLVKRLV